MNDAGAGPGSLWAFTGVWKLDRTIRHEDGRIDRFTGDCTFTRTGPRLVQEETGWLETSEGSFQGSRRYIWSEREGRLEVHFDDMRPFHMIPIGQSRPETVHLCPPDRYQVAYDFTQWPIWRTTWVVEGPRKDYCMESVFTPAVASAHLASANAAVHKSVDN